MFQIAITVTHLVYRAWWVSDASAVSYEPAYCGGGNRSGRHYGLAPVLFLQGRLPVGQEANVMVFLSRPPVVQKGDMGRIIHKPGAHLFLQSVYVWLRDGGNIRGASPQLVFPGTATCFWSEEPT